MKFGQDLFKFCGEKGLQIIELGEENGKFYISLPNDNVDPESFKAVLNELIKDKWTIQDPEIDQAINLYKFYFVLNDDALDNYSYQPTDLSIDVKSLDILEENKDKKVTKVEGPKDNIIHFDDGSIQVDLDAWTFNCIEKQVANLLRPMGNHGFLQAFDWATLVGHFLADEDFRNNELMRTGSQTGRWAIRGISPFGKEVLFILYDENGGDIPMVQAKSTYGVIELSEWFLKKYKDHLPAPYERKVKLCDGSIEKYGIDATGEAYTSWHRCGWLKELGL